MVGSDNSISERVLVMAASVRTGSINQALAHRIGDELSRSDESVGLVDLAEYPMPLYNGDLEARYGTPALAVRLAERIAAAEVLVIISPEYNGAFTPLLKNTVDWLTRVDRSIFAHLRVLLASASPGKGGGANSVDMIRAWMTNMGVVVADRTLSVGDAVLDDNGTLRYVDPAALYHFLAQVVSTMTRPARETS